MSLNQPLYCEDLGYNASQDRLNIKSIVNQARVCGQNDFLVQAASGKTVKIATGSCFVQQTESKFGPAFNGFYQVTAPTETNPNNEVKVSTEHPQVAKIVVTVTDVLEQSKGGASNAIIQWVNGTPSVGLEEENFLKNEYVGVAATPANSLVLAYVFVPKNAESAAAFKIQDVRPGAWITLPLDSHFENFGEPNAPFSVKVENKRAYLRGVLKIKSTAPTGQAIAVLPPIAHPTYGQFIAMAITTGLSSSVKSTMSTILKESSSINILIGQEIKKEEAFTTLVSCDGISYPLD